MQKGHGGVMTDEQIWEVFKDEILMEIKLTAEDYYGDKPNDYWAAARKFAQEIGRSVRDKLDQERGRE